MPRSPVTGALCALTVIVACKSEPTDPAPVLGSPAPGAEANEVVDVLRAVFPVGQAINDQENKWLDCLADLTRYSALLECETKVLGEIRKLNARLPAAPTAKLQCGRDIQLAHIEFASTLLKYHTAHLGWLTDVQPKLAPKMTGKRFLDVCDAVKPACREAPQDTSQGYARINTVECTKSLFICLPGGSNACGIGKVASRLGLGRDSHSGTLVIASTGTTVE